MIESKIDHIRSLTGGDLREAERLVIAAAVAHGQGSRDLQSAVVDALEAIDRLYGDTRFTEDPKLVGGYPKMRVLKPEVFWREGDGGLAKLMTYRDQLWSQQELHAQ